MPPYWEIYPEKATRWVQHLQATILRLCPCRQACFISIANAIEVQIEDGADPEVLCHLLRALLACGHDQGLEATALGLDEDVDTTLSRIGPKGP